MSVRVGGQVCECVSESCVRDPRSSPPFDYRRMRPNQRLRAVILRTLPLSICTAQGPLAALAGALRLPTYLACLPIVIMRSLHRPGVS